MKWILTALLLSAFSACGFLGYAQLVSATKRDLLRGLLFVVALGAFLLLPMYVLSLIFQANMEIMTRDDRFLAFMIWIGGISVVIGWRWAWFRRSLGVNKNA